MTRPRSLRLIAVVLRCYPARWRRRHGEEAAEVAALLLRDGRPAAAIALSYLRGACRERVRVRPSRRTVAASALAAGSLVGIPLALTSFSAAAAASVVRVQVTNPYDAATELQSEFRSHQFDILVGQEPVSPSLVGSIVTTTPALKLSETRGRCVGGAVGCADGVVLPSDFGGRARVVVGRAARDGERYAVAADIFRPGELLACSGLLGESVAQALPTLRRVHVSIVWSVSGSGGSHTSLPAGTDGIVGGVALSSSSISLRVVPPTTVGSDSPDGHDHRC